MKPPAGSSGHQAQERRRWDSQSLVRLAGRFKESHSAAFVMRLRSGDTGGHMLPAGPDYWLRRCARLVAWTLFSYCESLGYALLPQYGRLLTRIEMRSTKSVSQIITVILLRRCSRCSIQSRTSLSTYVPLTMSR
jgi:hypothetical protein